MSLHKPKLSREVAEALAAGGPVVALESTIITHGMPYPANLETALAVEDVVRQKRCCSGNHRCDRRRTPGRA